MLRTRLIVGTALAALAAGLLVWNHHLFLLVVVPLLGTFGTMELVNLLPTDRRPRRSLALSGVLVVLLLNWLPVAMKLPWRESIPANALVPVDGLTWVAQGFAAVVLAAFLVEMADFTGPGRAVERIALGVWIVAYLGLLPSFLIQLGFGRAGQSAASATVALALAIFVPKGCDIGAYFTGRLLGRHQMTPVLSPKKTWEGAAGGLALAVAVGFGLNRLSPVIPGGWAGTVGFGLSVGLAGMLGDLAESLIKRDCERKDASQTVPGFGGILDVVDAILFAAPVSFLWLR